MLWEVTYHQFTDYFTANSPAEAEAKARVLACNGSFSLRVIY